VILVRELLQIKLLHNRCKWMETIIVSWQNGIHFSVKRKLLLHRRFSSKLSWNEYIVSKIVFKAFLPKRFATHFYPLQTIVSLQVDRFSTVSKALQYRCKIVTSQTKSRNVSFRFCQIFVANLFEAKSFNGYQWVKTKNLFHPFATINLEKLPKKPLLLWF
jgi:hypothetical protein